MVFGTTCVLFVEVSSFRRSRVERSTVYSGTSLIWNLSNLCLVRYPDFGGDNIPFGTPSVPHFRVS